MLAAGTLGRASSGLAQDNSFPAGFLWGASTAGHQVEGNNTQSDLWLLEHLDPTVFVEPSGDANNSFLLWEQDLDLVKQAGLNSYRFSLEWARIEPEQGLFSRAMLDYYKAIIAGCRQRGLTPVVTFNHFTTPRWFAAQGGWTNPQAPALFANYCSKAAQHLGEQIGFALTLNEPQLLPLLKWKLPEPVWQANNDCLAAAEARLGVPRYSTGNVARLEDLESMQQNLLAGHKLGRDAIKQAHPDLMVGVSIAIEDDQAVGSAIVRDRKRDECYGRWLELASTECDFLGVQNYTRERYDADGHVPPPEDAILSQMDMEVYPASLANTVRYAHEQSGVPILVTEHGVASEEDSLRSSFIPAALGALKAVMDQAVPVMGYLHWTLLDNFEWIFGYRPKFGLVAVNRDTFERTPKPSLGLLGEIARRNSL